MTGQVLYSADFGSIQRFVFEVPRLRQMVGASALVRDLTETVPKQILDDLGLVAPDVVVYAGGGSITVILPSEEVAARFDSTLRGACVSRLGIDRFISSQVLLGDSFAEAWAKLGDTLRRSGAARAGAADPLSSPIAALCVECGYRTQWRPRGAPDDELCPLCRAREAAADTRGVLDELGRWSASSVDLKVSDDFERIAADSPTRMLALAVIDGNDIGRLVADSVGASAPQDARQTLGKLAGRLREVFGRATASAMGALGDTHCRPIIVGGDDIAVVLPAEQGIPFALRTIAGIESGGAVEGRNHLTACAGVCLFKYNFPFHAAHRIAEGALESAKGRARITGTSAIDWHVVQGGSASDLETARRVEFESVVDGRTYRFTKRPYAIGDGADDSVALGETVDAVARLGRSRVQEVRAMALDPTHEAFQRKDFMARLNQGDAAAFRGLLRAADGQSLYAEHEGIRTTQVLDAIELQGLDSARGADWGWS